MKVKYTNYLDEPITSLQLQALDRYNMKYYVDDLLKRIDHYRKNEIAGYTYYIENNENIADVFYQYPNSVIDIITTSIFGMYRVEEANYYKNGVLKFYHKELYDKRDRCLCTHEYDILTTKPVLDKTEKYLFIEDSESPALGFNYNSDGTINSIWGDWLKFTDQQRKQSILTKDISKYFPTLFADYPYFQNANFFPE